MSKECSDCSKPANNKFFNCAPRMADGRNFTDYRPRCIKNYEFFPENATPNAYEYRQFLIKNGQDLITKNKQIAYHANMCGPCTSPYFEGTMLPEQSMQKCNASTCTFGVNDRNGLGLGRDYGSLGGNQASFISTKEAEQKMISNMENCCSTQADDMNFYPFDYQTTGIINERPSVPSGGFAMAGTDRR